MANTKNGTSTNNRRSNSSPEVVSTSCFHFKSFLSLCRSPSQRHPVSRPSPKPPPPQESRPTQNPGPASSSSFQSTEGEAAAAAAANANWRRARKLEEKVKLEQRLAVKKRLAMGAAMEVVKLSDGSYLHEIKQVGRPWGALVMQVSEPLIVQDATAAAEVMRGMTSWKRAELSKHMHESMPISDLHGRQREQIRGRRVAMESEDDSSEGLLLSAMEEIEGLVLEGLRIQMGSSGGGAMDDDDQVAEDQEKKNKARAVGMVERIVLVMLIQIRDPEEKYAAVGEAMIGFIEAAAAAGDGRFGVQEVHIAGMKRLERGSGEGRDFIWSTSLRGCEGLCGGSSSSMQSVRNPDRFLA